MKFKIGMVILCLSVLSACDSGSNDPVVPTDPSKTDPPKTVAEDTGVDNTTESVQTTQTAASAGTEVVLATALTAKGNAEARLVKATRDGDKLSVTVRFKRLDDSSYSDTIYSGDQNKIYLVSGDKKYLILKDSQGKWLVQDVLSLPSGSGAMISWSTIFAAPPAGQQATLHMDGILEPLGPFTVP